jgi:hypothetical protein
MATRRSIRALILLMGLNVKSLRFLLFFTNSGSRRDISAIVRRGAGAA